MSGRALKDSADSADTALSAAIEADLDAVGAPAGQGDFVPRALAYARLLAKWNAKIRLVGPSDLAVIVREQLVDACGFCLAVGALPADSWWDIGAGGGLPGLVLALRFPERRFVLVEPIHKKTAFLQHAVRELGLDNVVVHTGRVEPDGRVVPALPLHDAPRAALSRATLAPALWLATARRLVGPGGVVLVALATEDPSLDPAAVIGRWSWTVPATGAPRTLLAFRNG